MLGLEELPSESGRRFDHRQPAVTTELSLNVVEALGLGESGRSSMGLAQQILSRNV
jgi:hypothetical protein